MRALHADIRQRTERITEQLTQSAMVLQTVVVERFVQLALACSSHAPRVLLFGLLSNTPTNHVLSDEDTMRCRGHEDGRRFAFVFPKQLRTVIIGAPTEDDGDATSPPNWRTIYFTEDEVLADVQGCINQVNSVIV
jgi:hypothetical protein